MPLIAAKTKTKMTIIINVMSKEPIDIYGKYRISDDPLNGGSKAKKNAKYKFDAAVKMLLKITFQISVSDLSVLIEASRKKIRPNERPSLKII